MVDVPRQLFIRPHNADTDKAKVSKLSENDLLTRQSIVISVIRHLFFSPVLLTSFLGSTNICSLARISSSVRRWKYWFLPGKQLEISRNPKMYLISSSYISLRFVRRRYYFCEKLLGFLIIFIPASVNRYF